MKALIIGLGSIGQRHVRNLKKLLGEDLQLLAYRVRRLPQVITPTLTADGSGNVETEYNIAVFDNLESALNESPQIAFVCNPSSLHVPVALDCVHAGCDVFLEKPVSSNLARIAELQDAVQQGRRILMVGYQLRFHPCLLRVQELVGKSTVGRPLTATARVGENLRFFHTYEDYRQMYASRSDLGGGVIVSQIHEFDYLYSLFGLPRRIFAMGGHLSTLEIDVEDVASSLMDFNQDGRRVVVHLHQDYLQRPASRGCEIICERGKISMDLVNLKVTSFDEQGTEMESLTWEALDRNQLFLDETRHFLDCVQSRKKPVVDLEDGVQSLRMALAARQSMNTGRVIELQENCEYVR